MEKYLRWKSKEIAGLFLGLIFIELAGDFLWSRLFSEISPYLFTFYLRVVDMIFILLFLKFKGVNFRAVGLTNLPEGLRGGIIASLVLGSAAFIIIFLLFKIFPRALPRMPMHTSKNFKILLIVYPTIPPLVEEIVFRGILYEFIKERQRTWIAIILSSLIFSLLHAYSWLFLLVPFIGGVFFCLLKDKFNSLWAPLILHITGNISLLLLPFFLSKL
ncbi:MAG: CPBP family intramembrane metalloprotease [Caldiserica bacterium]|nr:CPBP family intramembrane metalloprotease [Caldisericota bacterium]